MFSLDQLEYQRLKDLLRRYVSTDLGRKALDELRPIIDEATLVEEHAIAAEAMDYVREHRVRFPQIPLIPEILGKLTVRGTVLRIAEIEAVQEFLDHVEALRTQWKDERERFSKLREKSQRLPDLRDLRKQLRRAVNNGEVDERYSPELARLKRVIGFTRSRLKETLESLVRSPAHTFQVQEELITIRNGRYVIPVRAEQKRAFEGVVHGSSSSGATVFMEPLATIEMNNELVRLEEEEYREVQRILAELTEFIQHRVAQIEVALAVWAYLELTFAKAQFGREFDCVRPNFSKGPLLSLIKARHPLLEDNLRAEGGSIVPISLDIATNRRILVISGPNAGGKTVVLKTVGLLGLMAQAGIPLPAEEATLPVFDCVLADIGDQQSITNHLSTFSAHVLALKSMIETATQRSLILLDEIGGSTDPAEGAALARAVLEHFREAGALTIATTHYSRLKLYAETTPDVTNAAMEFNETTLEPTYRLLHGLAGSSSGLKIAERFQLPSDVLRSAWDSLDSADVEAALYVEELRRRVEDLRKEKSDLEKQRIEFEGWKQTEIDELKEQHKQAISRVDRRLETIVREMADRARKDLESVSDESKKRYERKLADARARAQAEIQRELQKLEPAPSPGPVVPDSTPPKVGAAVKVRSMGVIGSVSQIMEKDVEVIVGNVKLRRPIEDLEPIEKKSIELPEGVSFDFSSKELETNEINLIGCTVEEALSRTDKFLDDAYLARMTTVRIIHGTGMGILRKAISEFLTDHPHVARFETASPQAGGPGVTVVTLRE